MRVSLVCSKATGQWIFEKLADSPNRTVGGDLKWYQVEVKVVGLEITECLVEGFSDVIGVVMGVPEFAGDLYATIVTISDREILYFPIVQAETYKDLFTGDTRLLPPVSYFVFILIARRRIDVTVTLAESNFDRVLDFIRLG